MYQMSMNLILDLVNHANNIFWGASVNDFQAIVS